MSWMGGDTPPEGFDAVAREEPDVPTKVCPKCSVQERTPGAFCPHCGASYERGRRRRRMGKRTKIVLAVILLMLVAGGGVTGYVLKKDHDDKIADQRAEKRAIAAENARQAEIERKVAETEADNKRKSDELERKIRRRLISSVEKSVTKDARKDVANGVLDGPIVRTQCDPTGNVDTDDLTVDSGEYECLAANKVHGDGTLSGYRFSATVNFTDASYTWHLGG